MGSIILPINKSSYDHLAINLKFKIKWKAQNDSIISKSYYTSFVNAPQICENPQIWSKLIWVVWQAPV